MESDRFRFLKYRQSLQNLLEDVGESISLIDSDDFIINKISELVRVGKEKQKQNPTNVCVLCSARFSSFEELRQHQERHDPDGIHFSELGLLK